MRKSKVTIRIDGGLGNQMFMYAFAKFLQQQGYIIKLDSTAYKNRNGGGAET